MKYHVILDLVKGFAALEHEGLLTAIRACSLAGITGDPTLGFYSLSGEMFYRQILWSLESARLDIIMIMSL